MRSATISTAMRSVRSSAHSPTPSATAARSVRRSSDLPTTPAGHDSGGRGERRRGGAPGPPPGRLAAAARRSRQRRAEEAARKLPVQLLFPLVVCILPAFGLLTVAPLIAGGLRALRL